MVQDQPRQEICRSRDTNNDSYLKMEPESTRDTVCILLKEEKEGEGGPGHYGPRRGVGTTSLPILIRI